MIRLSAVRKDLEREILAPIAFAASLLSIICSIRTFLLPHEVRRRFRRVEANDLQEVESCLDDLAHPDNRRVRMNYDATRTEGKRYVPLLSGEPGWMCRGSPEPTLESLSVMSRADASVAGK